MSSMSTFPGFDPKSTRTSETPSCTRSAAPATPSVTALTKLFRTTTFRLSLTYLALFSAAAILVIFYIYWNTTVLLSRQLNQTIDAELTGLAEQYKAGGLDQLVSIGGGYWVSRKLLTRIDAISATSRTIMEGNLTGRLPVHGSGDELDRLSENLNLMLARIEQLMAGLREVSDNIAHDLKTPLNRLRNRVEEALREPCDETAYRKTLERTIEEADGLIKTFNALLSIARLEAGAGGENRGKLDMAALVRDVAELYEPVAEEQGIALKADAATPIVIHGDRQLLGQAIANLIDNALKYGAPTAEGGNGWAPEVEVRAQASEGVAQIIVSDRGPGVPAPERSRVLGRFVRLEASRSEPGSGLGLSLVAAVARLHGGSLRLEDNEPGLRVVLALPMEGDALVNGVVTEPPAGADLR